VTDEKALAEEREKVRLEYENEMKKMREQYLAEQDHKTKLQLDMEKLKQQYEEQLDRINKQVHSLIKYNMYLMLIHSIEFRIFQSMWDLQQTIPRYSFLFNFLVWH
jgi:hypothetical protein